ncbi:MAG: condensation domain-containing protein, partial [Bdellovibrionia bacterium]
DFKLDWREDTLAGVRAPWGELNKRLLEEGKKPFRLAEEPPIRFVLYDVVEETAVLAIVCHHIAMDGLSLATLLEDVGATYNSKLTGARPVLENVMHYEHFLTNPAKFGGEKSRSESKLYWESRFKGPGALVRWPGGGASKGLAGQRYAQDFAHVLHEKIKKAAPLHKATPLMLMLTGFFQTLKKATGQHEITVGIPVANRIPDGSDRMLAQCVNLAPIHVKINDAAPWTDLLKDVKSQVIGAFQNMMHPHEELLAHTKAPLFNVVFNLEPSSDMPDFGDVSLFLHPFPIEQSEYDMMINITDVDYLYHAEFDFRTDVIRADQVRAWVTDYIANLTKIVDSPAAAGPAKPVTG